MLSLLSQYGHDTFSSLQVRNYRLYYIGQSISTAGTFMQSVAQAWLVLQLTNSGTALGVVAALQYLPIMLLGPYGGVIADRVSKRKLLLFTQSAFGIQALILSVLVLTGLVQLWMVDVLALCYGIINALDNPTRQSFVVEMVGDNQVRNAVTLYSSLVNLARVIGPAIAGFLIATIGLAPCFMINSASYVAVVAMLLMMRTRELYSAPPMPRTKGQLRAGVRYVLSTPVLRNVLVMLAIVGTLTFEFSVSLPLLARITFHGDAQNYATLTASLGFGAVIGGLIIASRKTTAPSMLIQGALFFGLTSFLVASMPTLILAAVSLVAVGMASIYFTSLGNSILQLESAPHMRGRVMGLWSIAYVGSTAIGGPLVGWIGEHFEPRWALVVGGTAAVVAALYGYLTLSRIPSREEIPATAISDPERAAKEDVHVP